MKIPPPIPNTIANTNIGQQTAIPNTQTTIVKNGQEIVILSNNSMPHQPLHSPQINQASNFVVPNSGAGTGVEIGFNKCVAISQQAQVCIHFFHNNSQHAQYTAVMVMYYYLAQDFMVDIVVLASNFHAELLKCI